MWTCNIDHFTSYEYENEVLLEPHIVKLSPRLNLTRRLGSYEMAIDPKPAGRWSGIDAQGNQMEQIWFLGHHSHLKIHTKLSLFVEMYDPFHFVIFPLDAVEARYYHTMPLPQALRPYVVAPEASEQEKRIISTCLEKGRGEIISFLLELTRYIFVSIESENRELGPAKSPLQTLQDGKGSCRDLTVLFLQLCRANGIPARFTSGYHIQNEHKSELHAWAEVYIFGVGWIGFDPSIGSVCNWRYIPLASGISQQDTMPVTGSYFGAGNSKLDSKITVELVKSG